jgi:hypothetical protein
LRLVEQRVAKDDPDPKALACYGLLVRWAESAGTWHEEAWLRFVDGRPVSALTTQYLAWRCAELQTLGKEALLLIWDNAAWHVSREVRTWIRRHSRKVKLAGSSRSRSGLRSSNAGLRQPADCSPPQVGRGAARGRARRGWLSVGARAGQSLGVHSRPAGALD